MLKAKLESLDGIDETLQPFYQQTDDGYQLQVEGIEDTGALKRAKDHEKEQRKASEQLAKQLEEQNKELQAKLQAASDDKSRENGDVDALDKSWQEKYQARENELTEKLKGKDDFVRTLLVDNEASRIAAELAREGASKPLSRLIKDRLKVEERDGKPTTVVLDESGKPSAITVDELKTQLAADPALAGLIAGSQASGGGAPNHGAGGGASPNGDLSKMTREQQLAYFKSKQ